MPCAEPQELLLVLQCCVLVRALAKALAQAHAQALDGGTGHWALEISKAMASAALFPGNMLLPSRE